MEIEDGSTDEPRCRDQPCVEPLLVCAVEPEFFKGKVQVGRREGFAAFPVKIIPAPPRVKYHDRSDDEDEERCRNGERNNDDEKSEEESHAAFVFLCWIN